MASIRKRSKTYQVSVSNGRDSRGKQIIESATFVPDPGKTEKQNQKALERFAVEFEAKVKAGKYLDGEKLTFQSFVPIWHKDYAEMQLEETTLQLYDHLLRLHILPAIGNIKLAKILPAHLNKLYNQLAVERKDGKDGGYAPKTIKHVHNLISSIFSMAIKWNIVTDNPCDRVVPPKQIPACDKVKYFTVEQTEIFIGLLDQRYTSTYRSHDRIDDTGIAYHVDEYTETRTVPTQFKLFYLLAIYCGMRRGEILALEWSDLDFSNNSISITKSTTIANGKPITKTPKTKASIRKISVPAFLMELARNYRREQLQYRLSLGSEWVGENYVFIQANGKQMHPDTPYNKFKSIIRCYNAHIIKEEEKLPEISLHGLRHTSATLMISQNVDIRTVSNRLGHAQTSTTLDIYSHALQKMDEQASSALDTLLNHKISS